jgi:hypothetical protein
VSLRSLAYSIRQRIKFLIQESQRYVTDEIEIVAYRFYRKESYTNRDLRPGIAPVKARFESAVLMVCV